MSDGKIVIETEVDNSGAEKGFEKTKASARAQAAKLAAEYKKQGMSASEAFKKAWSEIEQDANKKSKDTANNWNNNLVGKLNSIAKSGLKLVTGAISSAGATIGGLGVAATKAGMTFEKSMSQVYATMGITTEEIAKGSKEVQMLEKAAKDMGATTQFSASQAGEALNYLALAKIYLAK